MTVISDSVMGTVFFSLHARSRSLGDDHIPQSPRTRQRDATRDTREPRSKTCELTVKTEVFYMEDAWRSVPSCVASATAYMCSSLVETSMPQPICNGYHLPPRSSASTAFASVAVAL